jgi:GR25 family glycosyltransferase involved in LPS biosynthesis
MDPNNTILPIYAVNLKKRVDRREHLRAEFADKTGFSLQIVEAVEHSFGAFGLWQTICKIIKHMSNPSDDFIIICEDDVQFTKHFTYEYLLESILLAKKANADMLIGGVSWFSNSIQFADRLFWVENFSGLQFTVLFRKFFATILNASVIGMNATDFHLASITDNAMFMYPFIATQKEFGYSDATPNNNQEGRVTALFNATIEKVNILNKVRYQYKRKRKKGISYVDPFLTIPTYVINLPERKERLTHIMQQFESRREFDVTIVPAVKHPIGAYSLWLSMRKVINLALENNDDVIVMCEDDHQFTKEYSREYFLRQVIEAYEEDVYYLCGGTGKFDQVVPITENRFWVNHCLSCQFLVLYKPFFRRMLAEPFDEKIIADLAYPLITSNKVVLYPFISTQRDFGYSDVTALHNTEKGIVDKLFAESDKRLARIQQIYNRYRQMNL